MAFDIGAWLADNYVLFIAALIIIFALVLRHTKKKKAEKAIAVLEKPVESTHTFDSVYLEQGLLKANFVNGSELGHLKERLKQINSELKEKIETFNNAKKRYKELEILGRSYVININTLKKEKEMYEEKIKALEAKDGGK